MKTDPSALREANRLHLNDLVEGWQGDSIAIIPRTRKICDHKPYQTEVRCFATLASWKDSLFQTRQLRIGLMNELRY
jgi:hypothetical protein